MKDVIEFLEKNGFALTEPIFSVYSNYKCEIIIHKDHYTVINRDGMLYSTDLNIYWLIGVLTYYNYMDKNYKTQINKL